MTKSVPDPIARRTIIGDEKTLIDQFAGSVSEYVSEVGCPPGSAVPLIAGDPTFRRPSAEPNVLVSICTLRESANVVAMLQALRAACPAADLLVLDDNSDDGTAELARQFASGDTSNEFGSSPGTFVIVREQRGLGGAIVATMNAAIDREYDWLVNLDADFSHDPAAVPLLIETAIGDDADVVVGSRYAAGGRIDGWTLHRRWMSRLINRLAISRLRLPVSDCSGSMRCYRVDALRRMNPARLRFRGYAVLEEILLRLSEDETVRFAEVPITFVDREAGHSKLTLTEAIRSLVNILTLRRKLS